MRAQARRKAWGLVFVMALAVVMPAHVASGADQPPKVHRIGFLQPGLTKVAIELVALALQDLGYVEGKNIVFEYRFAEGKPERLPGLAAELKTRPRIPTSSRTT